MIIISVSPAPFLLAMQPPISLNLSPDVNNPSSPIMGNHLRFISDITNMDNKTIEGVVAWLSLVEVDPGNEQPVDLEDWSAHKAVTGARLEPGKPLKTDWSMRLIKGGDYRIVISVTTRNSRNVFTSPVIQFHVRQKPVLKSSRVLPIAVGIPLLIGFLIGFTKYRQKIKIRSQRY